MPSTSSHHNHHQIEYKPNSNSNSSKTTTQQPTIASSASVFAKMSLEEVLEDLASRFILNLPTVESTQIERVCFQVEQAHWFYEDFVRPNNLLNLPSYNLKAFTKLFFDKCHFLRIEGAPLYGWDPQTAYDKFLRYKERVPVCGAIILNSNSTKVLLVKGYKSSSSWSFPRGKINENEQPRDCAIREVLEETGFDISSHMNLSWGQDSKLSAIQKPRPSNPTPSGHNLHHYQRNTKHSMLQSEGDDHFIEIMIREQKLRMYLVTGIPDETVFETQTRQEISAIAWCPLSDLPTFTSEPIQIKKPSSKPSNFSSQPLTEPDIHGFRASAKFYMVVPFVSDLRNWLLNHDLICSNDYGLPISSRPEPTNQHPPHMILSEEQNETHKSKVRYALYPGSNNFEAAAVYERARRLQSFQFDDEVEPEYEEELVPSPQAHPHPSEVKLTKKKKKKGGVGGHRKKSVDRIKVHARAQADVSIDDQPRSSATEDEGEMTTDWNGNGIEDGPRVGMQNMFFGGSKANGSAEVSAEKVPKQFLNQPQRDGPQNQLTSDADTDVVKGYDIATSYASSISSSYRESFTQIPSSDESAPSLENGQLNSANLLSQLLTSNPSLDLAPPVPQMNEAEAQYSKHGHLAAPRPQPAPQQVERLLAMLQAPTPGPHSILNPQSSVHDLSQLDHQPLAHDLVQLNHQTSINDLAQIENQQSNQDLNPLLNSDSDLEQKTPRYHDHQNFVESVTTELEINLTSPGSGKTALHRSTSTRPITPRPTTTTTATNLLDLLINGSSSSQQQQQNARSIPLSTSNRLPLKESERKLKQDALLRQLQSLTNLNLSA
ncbi:hypothetical protein CROQUDRAFT_721469 [Cronartium quercuum f. sp. fusiforme G11]|uniref:Nudix hydrolase domain-containing protein n=1 Tax=Cronartium quercuum f. sp. fusiforme G11 TaxID=708437 RepID=A0A9P6NR94_9BASI|nr:hypothetical protein CROQUDRAFT_721469 [Cronartium quercuum f. sp. fusiforme G11]